MNPAPTSQEGGKESQTTNLKKELVVVECTGSVPKKRSREPMKKAGAKKVSRPENGSGPKEKEKGRKGNSIRAPLGVITNTNSNQLRDTPETEPEPKLAPEHEPTDQSQPVRSRRPRYKRPGRSVRSRAGRTVRFAKYSKRSAPNLAWVHRQRLF